MPLDRHRLLSRVPRGIGIALIVGGGFGAVLGAFGDQLIQGERSSTYVDPSSPMSLEPGGYPVEWVGPAKGDVPFPSDLVIRLQVSSGKAVWRESDREIHVPIGPSEDDQVRSPLGVVEVLDRSVLSIDLDLRTDLDGSPRIFATQGAPRILVETETGAPPATRSGPLLIGGVITMFVGLLLRKASMH